jgi:hypothetical protein
MERKVVPKKVGLTKKKKKRPLEINIIYFFGRVSKMQDESNQS